jgi:hypothetical protein
MESPRPPTGRTIVNKAATVPSHREAPSGGPPSVLGESHIQLRVTDLNRSAEFYTEIVGLREHVRSDVQVILTCGTWQMGMVASVHRASDPRTDNPPRSAYDIDHAGLQRLAFALVSAAEVDAAAPGWTRAACAICPSPMGSPMGPGMSPSMTRMGFLSSTTTWMPPTPMSMV